MSSSSTPLTIAAPVYAYAARNHPSRIASRPNRQSLPPHKVKALILGIGLNVNDGLHACARSKVKENNIWLREWGPEPTANDVATAKGAT